MTTATTGSKRLFNLQRAGICSGCQVPQPAGTKANAVGSVVYCESCTYKWAAQKGYTVIDTTVPGYVAPSNAPQTAGTPYMSRTGFEQAWFALNERLALKFGEINQKILKLEAENAALKMAVIGKPTEAGAKHPCKVDGCKFVADSPQALGGHSSVHKAEAAQKAPEPKFEANF